jgi:hypothetical protein
MKLNVRIYSNWASGYTIDFVNYKILQPDSYEFLKTNLAFENSIRHGIIYFVTKKINEVRFENKIKNS